MLKIVQVGAGFFSTLMHGPMIRQYASDHPGRLELAAVCVRKDVEKAKGYCREFGFARVYTDIDEMVRSEKPDAAWVLTSLEATRAAAGKLMELGVPVLMEKPPGTNLEEAKELAEIARRTGTPHMVGFNRRFARCTQAARAWLKDRGPFEAAEARMLRAGRDDAEFAYGTGIHAIDCLHMLGDLCLGGMTSARVLRSPSFSGTWNFHVEVAFGSGATGRCELQPNCGVNEETYTLFGRNTCVTFSMPWIGSGSRAELWEDGKLLDSARWPAESAFVDFGFYQEYEAFVEALADGRKPWPSVEETLDTVALAEAAQAGRDWKV